MFSKKNKYRSINYLDMTPLHVHDFEINTEGFVDVLVPRFSNRFFELLLIPKGGSKFIKANLDDVGTATWLAIDGKNNVRDIISLMDDNFGEKVAPADQRVTVFLNQLHGNGFITFIEFIKGSNNG